jgi:hypothetical protein
MASINRKAKLKKNYMFAGRICSTSVTSARSRSNTPGTAAGMDLRSP